VRQFDSHRIIIKFPRDGIFSTFDPASSEVLSKFPNLADSVRKKGLTAMSVHLRHDVSVKVDGFGIPFANVGDPVVAGWVNENKPIAGNATLLSVLQRERIDVLVANPVFAIEKEWDESRLPPPFDYGYGNEHSWKLGRYKKLLEETKSKQQFLPAYR